MNAALGSGRGLCDRLDQSITDIVCTITLDLIILSDVHDSLIELALNHLVVTKALLAYSQLGLDISTSLPSRAFELVVLAS